MGEGCFVVSIFFLYCTLVEFGVVSEEAKWSQAQTSCLGLQGDFASIMTDQQAYMIADKIKS